MATVEENRRYWEEVYSWSQGGEEWSRGWGGTAALWKGSLLPRLQRFLPAPTVLEIAPGHGRFTPYLKEHCQRYIGVDISPRCIEVCRQRFPHDEFHVNDGQSLSAVADRSVDLAFSFFSLIHAEEDTMAGYLHELARVLKPGGGAFLHHSNLKEHESYFRKTARLPKPLSRWLFGLGLLDLPQWRATSVSARTVANLAGEAGLAVLTQETVNFGSRRTIDAFTSLTRGSGEARVWNNPQFMHEAMRIRLRQGDIPSAILAPGYY